MHAPRLTVLLCAISGFGQPLRHKTTTFQSREGRVAIEEYASRTPATDAAAVILLYGSGGLQSSGFPYAEEARLFGHIGCRVYLPHYLDVTRGHAGDPESHYGIWAQAVREALQYIRSGTDVPPSRTAIVGYSLGGSVALSVAAVQSDLAGIVVWSGSLPDAYRDVAMLPPLLILHGGRDPVIPADNARQLATLCKIKRLRCELSIYNEEGHAFSAAGLTRANRQIQAFLDAVLGPR